MRKFVMPALATLLLASAPAVAESSSDEPARDAKGKITDKNHPEYVKCRTESVIGSRAKKRRVCLTNAEWERVAREGNAVADKLVEDMASGTTTN